jgi:hypothetical protein
MEIESLKPAIGSLLHQIGCDNKRFQIKPLPASGNNRGFLVDTKDGPFFLKWYFSDYADTRDRLGAEFAFLVHAWETGLRCIPRPLARNSAAHLALYEFVEGEKLEQHRVDGVAVKQAANFLAALNTKESRVIAQTLPDASEACFSLREHLKMVDARIERLRDIPCMSEVDQDARHFATLLERHWKDVKDDLIKGLLHSGLSMDATLTTSQRCLSPSDFGFHNALMRTDGSLCFIDFEYAGWDDPAKVVGDFFSQPGIPVPKSYLVDFLDTAFLQQTFTMKLEVRLRLMEPIFKMKWCCIMLNEFLSAAARRRNFANEFCSSDKVKRLQLNKAITLYEMFKN